MQRLHLQNRGGITEFNIYFFHSLFSFPSFDVMNQFWKIKWHFRSNEEESSLVQTLIREVKWHRSMFRDNLFIILNLKYSTVEKYILI